MMRPTSMFGPGFAGAVWPGLPPSSPCRAGCAGGGAGEPGAVSVLPGNWRGNQGVSSWVLERLRSDEYDLPSYMQVKRFAFVDTEWTQTDGFLTPTLKLKRRKITEYHADLIEALYPDHDQDL